jgi:hypothetical protein
MDMFDILEMVVARDNKNNTRNIYSSERAII